MYVHCIQFFCTKTNSLPLRFSKSIKTVPLKYSVLKDQKKTKTKKCRCELKRAVCAFYLIGIYISAVYMNEPNYVDKNVTYHIGTCKD